MTNLSDFGAGITPEKRAQDETVAHETRTERAKHRRRTYRLGRCRAISTSKGCRCGGAVIDETDGDLCHYHGMERDSKGPGPVTLDSASDLLARWCGTRPTEWDEIPEPCREALLAICPDAADRVS